MSGEISVLQENWEKKEKKLSSESLKVAFISVTLKKAFFVKYTIYCLHFQRSKIEWLFSLNTLDLSTVLDF